MLGAMYPTVLAATLEILDTGKVTKFVTLETRREFYRVKEIRGVGQYYDIVGDFCFCFFYAKQCLESSGSSLTCKHVLAAKLAAAIGEGHPDKLTVKEIEEQDFAPLMLASKNHLAKFDEKRTSELSSFMRD